MAIKDTVKPTRSELIMLKKRIKLSETGYKLLKMKRDGLILEFFEILEKAKDIRTELQKAYAIAEEKISIARAVDGQMAVKSASFAMRDRPQIELDSKSVMGVVVPKIEAAGVKKHLFQRGYGIIGTSSRIDEAAYAYEALLEKVIAAAEIETAMKRLLDEIEKTKRRVNALEYRVIPELKEAAAYINFRLEEMERENIIRLKKLKIAA